MVGEDTFAVAMDRGGELGGRSKIYKVCFSEGFQVT